MNAIGRKVRTVTIRAAGGGFRWFNVNPSHGGPLDPVSRRRFGVVLGALCGTGGKRPSAVAHDVSFRAPSPRLASHATTPEIRQPANGQPQETRLLAFKHGQFPHTFPFCILIPPCLEHYPCVSKSRIAYSQIFVSARSAIQSSASPTPPCLSRTVRTSAIMTRRKPAPASPPRLDVN